MEDLVAKRRGLEDEILRLADEESRIDSELHEYFSSIVGGQRYSSHSSNSSSTAPITKHHASINKTAAHSGNVKSSKISFDSLDISSNILRIEKFGPSFEAMQQDSKKLISQIDDCRQLSERLSSIVRRLDVMQIRSQQALACTEDIINLKECKTRIIAAIEENNLSSAVSYLRQVKDIDPVAARSSDDYEIIKSKELEIKRMVQVEFQKAIEDSNIKSVMSLCPLLQTLGLESEARDNFLTFIEKTVFIAVSADAASVDGATDPATAYAKSLSSVFNSSYIIIQQYLPMVIQGMENSLGDVFFIRRLHKKSESEAGSVLKRYMKYRNLRDIINSLKTTSATTAAATATSTNAKQVSPAEVHCIMDELALLIQYCCRYAKFLKQICTGAEAKSRVRPGGVGGSNDTTGVDVVAVFTGPTEFDKMVDELINKYYMEGETWLMRQGVSKALPRGVATTTTTTAVDLQESIHLDECFFMLQKCGLRSIATNNIHAACAVLHTISDLLSTDLVAQASSMLTSATTQIAAIMQEHINKFKKSIANTASGDDPSSSAGPSVRGFKNAFLLGASSSSVQTSDTSGEGIRLHEEGGFILVSSHHVKGDPWGVASMTEAFNVIELCVRYTDRLNKDISEAGGVVFANSSSSSSTSPDSSSGSSDRSKSSATNKSAKTPSPQVVFSHVSTELDKLKLCTEDFEAAKHLFSNVSHSSIYSSMHASIKLYGCIYHCLYCTLLCVLMNILSSHLHMSAPVPVCVCLSTE